VDVIVAESRRGRRLVGRLDRGVELVAALLDVCRSHGVHSGEVRAFGSVEEVELREFDQRGRAWRAPRRFASAFTIVQLTASLAEHDGRPHLEATCTLSRERDNGIELLGGQLVRARVYAVEFVIEAFDDLLLRRSMDAATGMLLLTEAIASGGGPAPQAEAPAPVIPFEAPPRGRIASPAALSVEEAAPSWSEVAARSAVQPEPVLADEAEPEAPLRAGDVIDHPRFGRCEVERIEGDMEYAQVRLRNARLVRLSLDVLQLVRDGSDAAGHRLYRAQVPR
jgi:predicted DNA-binding protein with PD1-like motif